MNDEQLLRYARHILLDDLGIEGQEKLLASRVLIVGAGGLVDRDPELVFLEPCRNVGMRLRVDVGIDPQRDRGPLAGRSGDPGKPAQLGHGFDVEALDAGRERRPHFPDLLAYTGKHDSGWIGSGRKHARELTARDDVESAAQAREFPEHGQVRIRLHAVAHQHVAPADCLLVGGPGRTERGARIHVKRGTQRLGEVVQTNPFGVERITLVMEMRRTGRGTHCERA